MRTLSFITLLFLLPVFAFTQSTFTCGTSTDSNFGSGPPPNQGCFGQPQTRQFVQNDQALLDEYLPIPSAGGDEIVEIKVKFWVMQFSAADPRNFTAADEPYLESLIDVANGILGNLVEPLNGSPNPISYPNGATHIPDAGFRLVLEDIEYVQDPVGWNNASSTCGSYAYNAYGSQDCYYDIFFLGDGRYSGCGPLNFSTLVDFYRQYLANEATGCCFNVFNHAFTLLHELGHSFGLAHSHTPQFDDIYCSPCNFNNCDPESDLNCINNIMSYAGTRMRNFTPHQLAAMRMRIFAPNNSPYVRPAESSTTTISGHQTWSFARLMPGDIIIPSGSSLRIECKVLMPANSKIVVQKGGRLIVNNGHITTNAPKCDGYWSGILVEGDNNGVSSAAVQGYVLLQNDALIEWANTGISVKGGGIVRGSASTIRNCRYALYYFGYPRSQRARINLNYFDGCYFGYTDEHLLDVNPLVTLNNLGGIRFNNCEFKDERTAPTPGINTGLQYVTGLRTNSANFRITDGTVFEDLFIGIEAGVTGRNMNFAVRDAEFQDCFGGIVSRGINDAVIMNNSFRLGSFDLVPIPGDGNPAPQTHWDGFGISIQSGTSYKIEANAFTRTPSNASTLGIYLNDTGTKYNRILGNSFNSITVSNYVQGLNGEVYSMDTGLEFLCNTNFGNSTGSSFDFYVEPGGRIKPEQGSSTNPAGNTFRDLGFAAGNDFHNAPDSYELRYFYDANSSTEVPDNGNPTNVDEIVNVLPIPLNQSTGCGGDDGNEDDRERLTPSERIAREGEFTVAHQSLVQVINQFFALLDDGDTDALVDRVRQTASSGTPAERIQLANDLLNTSPFISSRVIETLAEEVGIPKAVVLSVAHVNPESIKNPSVQAYIATERNLTNAEVAALAVAAQQTSARTPMVADLSAKHQASQLLGHRLLIAANADTLFYTEAYEEQMLTQMDDVMHQYQLMDLYRDQSNTIQLAQTLAATEATYLRTTFEEEQHQAYLDFQDLASILKADQRDWSQLTQSELGQLNTMAMDNAGLGSAMARQVVNFAQGQTYLKLPVLPATMSVQQFSPATNTTDNPTFSSVQDDLIAYPNPATDIVTFRLPDLEENGFIEVFDSQSRRVAKLPVSAQQYSVQWQPTATLDSGLYFFRLVTTNHLGGLKKLVLLR